MKIPGRRLWFYHRTHELSGRASVRQPASTLHIYRFDSQNFPPFHNSRSASLQGQNREAGTPASADHSPPVLLYGSAREAELFSHYQDQQDRKPQVLIPKTPPTENCFPQSSQLFSGLNHCTDLYIHHAA